MAARRQPPDVLQQLEQLLVPSMDGELTGFLESHRKELAEALGIDAEQLDALRDHDRRLVQLQELVTRARKARKDRHREQRTQLAIAAAGMLSRLARWAPERIELSADIVLGQSLVPPGARWMRLAPEGRRAVMVPASRLRAAGRVLRKRPDVTAYLDDQGLVFEWKDGRGRLRLNCRTPVPRQDAGHIFPVELEAPSPSRRSGAWIGEVLGQLGYAL